MELHEDLKKKSKCVNDNKWITRRCVAMTYYKLVDLQIVNCGPEGADINTQLSGLGIGCAIPPLGQGLSDSEEHAHTVQYVASSHHVSPGNCPLQLYRPPLSPIPLCVPSWFLKEERIMDLAWDGISWLFYFLRLCTRQPYGIPLWMWENATSLH